MLLKVCTRLTSYIIITILQVRKSTDNIQRNSYLKYVVKELLFLTPLIVEKLDTAHFPVLLCPCKVLLCMPARFP